MLSELHITNFAVIEKQAICFGPGLNVLSGETGAGKSVVLQALELILGARPKTNYERPGSSGWEIQALFDLSQLPVAVAEKLPDIARSKELLLSRTMSDGRGRVSVNGRLATVSLLEEIAGQLINICGQGQQMRLLDPHYHRELLDNFAGHNELLLQYRDQYNEWNEKRKSLVELETQASRNAERRDELSDLVTELTTLGVCDGLREQIEDRIAQANQGEELIAAGSRISSLLDSDDGLYVQLSRLRSLVKEIEAVSPDLHKAAEALARAEHEIGLAEDAVAKCVRGTELDEEEIEELRGRLSQVAGLERRHRTNSAGLAELLARSQEQLSQIDDPTHLEALRKDVSERKAAVEKLAAKLSKSRLSAAKEIAKVVQGDLSELNMHDSRIEVEVTETELGPEGREKVQFLLASHSKGTPRPLAQIASGGELARITLVLKKTLRERSGVNVLVFDEVDTGVSGSVARAMGMKLKQLSINSQVLCITHLPQVASLADRHLLVQKHGGSSSIVELSKSERIEEIARMLAGYKVTDASRESAKELLASNI